MKLQQRFYVERFVKAGILADYCALEFCLKSPKGFFKKYESFPIKA